jgi:hypothetical protein
MKKIIASIIFTFITILSMAQVAKKPIEKAPIKSNLTVPYRLFPTQNMWTFIKLNTTNGQMWQVQYGMELDSRIISNLNIEPLVNKEKEVNDRFTLYPTQNMYTFILLDQLDGRTWQVQWSHDPVSRIVLQIE